MKDVLLALLYLAATTAKLCGPGGVRGRCCTNPWRNNRVVRVERRVKIGTADRLQAALWESEDSETLNTSFVERLNLTIRQASAYLRRRSPCHARGADQLRSHVELVRCHYNFVRPHRALRFGRETRTPAIQAGLVSTRLALSDIFTTGRVTLRMFVAVVVTGSAELPRLSWWRANERRPDQQRTAQAPVVPPHKTARVSRRRPRSSARDRTIEEMKKIGRRRWKQASGYHRQARVENTFFRYKSIIGGRLRARSPLRPPDSRRSRGRCNLRLPTFLGLAADSAFCRTTAPILTKARSLRWRARKKRAVVVNLTLPPTGNQGDIVTKNATVRSQRTRSANGALKTRRPPRSGSVQELLSTLAEKCRPQDDEDRWTHAAH